jgi:hypothetical protein
MYSRSWMRLPFLTLIALLSLTALSTRAQSWVYLTEVPDYTWYAGCFGTATGNLMGYWDRHGMTNFYSGPTAGGVAPLDTCGSNIGIRSMWASRAGFDGRSLNSPGHIDDYWSSYFISFPTCGLQDSYSYQSTVADPYLTAGRPEHAPDCIGDFIGLSQKKWTNMANECDGNIDAFSFVFWDKTGNKRINYSPTNAAGQYVPDIQSGLRAWTQYRGYDAEVFTQLPDFSPERSTTNGFTYEDMKAEINAGYPVLLFLQPRNQFSRALGNMPRANPEIHGIMVYGYLEDPGSGLNKGILIRTSWGSGEVEPEVFDNFEVNILRGYGYYIRGVIGYHPKPKITGVTRGAGTLTITWEGPSAQLHDQIADTTTTVTRYQLERSTTLSPPKFAAVGTVTTNRTATVADDGPAFYRVRLSP